MNTSSPVKAYLIRFFLKYSTIEFYFDSITEFNNYYTDLKATREVLGYEFIRNPGIKSLV